MSFLTNRPQAADNLPFVSFGATTTKLIVGLGNIGAEYDNTRHNIGFVTVDHFVEHTDELSDWVHKKDLSCHLSSGQLGQTRVVVIKPTTFMNNSGTAVQAVMSFYKIPSEQVVVLHDELDIDFGSIRLRIGGSPAGNNGIKSINQHIGENYGRIRIGIGPKNPPQIDSAQFVLQKFTAEQQAAFPDLTRETHSILHEYVYGGSLPHDTRSFIL